MKINDYVIERVCEFNFLGLIIDENLSWNAHIQKVSNKISRTLGTLNRLKRLLPQYILKLLYNSLVMPHLQYAILCWGFKHGRLFKLQKRAMRIITCSKYNAHTDPIFRSLNLLKIHDIFKISLLKYYYKLKNNTLPHYLLHMFPVSSQTDTYGTRNRNIPIIPVSRTSSASYCIRYYLHDFLLSTPDSIKDKVFTHSPKGYSDYAKRHYLNQYTNVCTNQQCYICNSS